MLEEGRTVLESAVGLSPCSSPTRELEVVLSPSSSELDIHPDERCEGEGPCVQLTLRSIEGRDLSQAGFSMAAEKTWHV